MLYLIAYSLFCVWFAYMNAVWIKKNKRIKHGWNGLTHLAASVAGFYFFDWKIGLAVLFVARLFFDTSLNLFRGLSVGYVSRDPKSIVDRIEKKVFKNDGIVPKILYLAIIVVLVFS